MSLLTLTYFNKAGALAPNDAAYKDWERDTVPTKGMPIFIFEKEEKDATRIANINNVKMSFGYAKDIKFNEFNNAQVKSVLSQKETYNENRTKELKKMYERLSVFFLEILHEATWLKFSNPTNQYVKSTIDYEDIYEPLKAAMDALRIVLKDIINDKYNYKYVENETEYAVKKNALENQFALGKTKKGKKD